MLSLIPLKVRNIEGTTYDSSALFIAYGIFTVRASVCFALPKSHIVEGIANFSFPQVFLWSRCLVRCFRNFNRENFLCTIFRTLVQLKTRGFIWLTAFDFSALFTVRGIFTGKVFFILFLSYSRINENIAIFVSQVFLWFRCSIHCLRNFERESFVYSISLVLTSPEISRTFFQAFIWLTNERTTLGQIIALFFYLQFHIYIHKQSSYHPIS